MNCFYRIALKIFRFVTDDNITIIIARQNNYLVIPSCIIMDYKRRMRNSKNLRSLFALTRKYALIIIHYLCLPIRMKTYFWFIDKYECSICCIYIFKQETTTIYHLLFART